MQVVALVQARTDSSRLPRKVLKKILGEPMILHQLKRTKESIYIDKIILVTSDENSDDELSSLVEENGFQVYRGDKKNVLKRFYTCLETLNLEDNDIIVRLTGDCPLHDAVIIDESIKAFINDDCDYLANCVEPIYPDGLDVEVFNYKTLKHTYKKARKLSELEHVTPFIRDSGLFIIKHLKKDTYYADLRLTVDEESDFILIERIYRYFNKSIFSLDKIIEYLEENSDLIDLNKNIKRNEGYKKSLMEENNDNKL